MGNELSLNQKSPAYRRLGRAIPPFRHEQEREDFIFSLITVLSSNNTIPLDSRDFKMVYARRKPEPPNPASQQSASSFSWPAKKPVDRIFASLVLVDEHGSIKSKIEPDLGGKDQTEAFQLFRKHVEVMLDKVLADVTPVTANAAPAVQERLRRAGREGLAARENEAARRADGDEVPFGVMFDVAPPSYEKSQGRRPLKSEE